MADDEKELFASLNYWSTRIVEAGGQFDNANTMGIQLPVAASRQLRNLSEAVSACEQLVQSLVGKTNPSEEVLRRVADQLRTIHQRLDDVVLPATLS